MSRKLVTGVTDTLASREDGYPATAIRQQTARATDDPDSDESCGTGCTAFFKRLTTGQTRGVNRNGQTLNSTTPASTAASQPTANAGNTATETVNGGASDHRRESQEIVNDSEGWIDVTPSDSEEDRRAASIPRSEGSSISPVTERVLRQPRTRGAFAEQDISGLNRWGFNEPARDERGSVSSSPIDWARWKDSGDEISPGATPPPPDTAVSEEGSSGP
ncbi:hypothetical protein IAT40_007420 [Kwoniella sp. CBS 6097]